MRALSCIAQSSLAGYNEAEALCRRAIAISRSYGQAHSLLSWVLLRRTDWSGDVTSFLTEAEAEAQTALDIDERDPWAHLTNGLVLYRQRRHGEAERAYGRALELNPDLRDIPVMPGCELRRFLLRSPLQCFMNAAHRVP